MAFLGMAMIIDSRGIDEFFDTRVKISGLDESSWHVTPVQILCALILTVLMSRLRTDHQNDQSSSREEDQTVI